jgi:hypothetical protein
VTTLAPALCTTTLQYFGGPTSSGAVDVTIHDGRAADLPGWETCGFQLLSHASDVTDWGDDDQICSVHYPEMQAIAKELSGADHTLLIGHIKRNPEQARAHHDLAPIPLVHCDFADSYEQLLRDRYRKPGPEEAAALEAAGLRGRDVARAERLLVLQFWRNVGPVKMDMPLAWCDARTVPRRAIRPFPVTNYAGGGFDFEALGFEAPRDPSAHEWYGFDRMQVDEVVAFRTFDTAMVATGEPYWTPHSAYRDPEVALGQPSRSSVELRVTCVFE